MKEVQIEFPAYNIFFRQGGMWILHGEPVIGKPFQEVQCIATGILFGSKVTDAVRIYGIFNCQQTFIKELTKADFPTQDTEEDRMRSAIKAAIAICNEAINDKTFYGESASLLLAIVSKIRELLSAAVTTTER